MAVSLRRFVPAHAHCRGRQTLWSDGAMAVEEQILREKALLLVTRERELVTLRNKHVRLLNWLVLSQSLPTIVRRDLSLSDIGSGLVRGIISLIKLQKVQLLEVLPQGLRVFGKPGFTMPALEKTVLDWLEENRSGLFNEAETLEQRALAGVMRLQRVLWYRVDALPGVPVLLLGGFDEQRAACYPPFDQEDAEHFAHAGQHFEALLKNVLLVNELAQDKARLEQFNAELERRVQERTAALACANQETSRALEALQEKDRRLSDDLTEARAFQQRVLPTLPRMPWIELAAVYRPVDLVGGDIYDVAMIGARLCRLFVADATGHGVQASLRTISIKSAYDRLKQEQASPQSLLLELNRVLVESFTAAEMMFTACCFDLVDDGDGDGVTLRYTNAAHPGLIVQTGGELKQIYHQGPFLGLSSDASLEVQEMHLLPGACVLAFSDGFSDQLNERGETIDLPRTIERALIDSKSLSETLDRMIVELESFRGSVPIGDDVTVLAARVRGAPG